MVLEGSVWFWEDMYGSGRIRISKVLEGSVGMVLLEGSLRFWKDQ